MTRSFAERLLAWFDDHGRKTLPWQHERTPYRVWISEIMLQQTQVATVVPYYERFMAHFPDVRALAGAELEEVLGLWSGLGYYSRARNLHKAARTIATEFDGRFPETVEAVTALPGIGRSTAGAILALALGRRHPILDGNVKRVLARHRLVEGWPGQSAVERQLWADADAFTPEARLADYTQAIMDLGATVCTPRNPACERCPVQGDCGAAREGRQEELPTPKPRKRLPERHTAMLVIVDGRGRVLLQRRPPAGIWGGLWSLPEWDGEGELRHWCRERLGLELLHVEPAPRVRHTFSHFHLDIDPYYVEAAGAPSPGVAEPEAMAWHPLAASRRLGLPAPVARLLAGLAEEPTSAA